MSLENSLFKTLSGTITRNRSFGYWDDPTNPMTDGQQYQWRTTININPRFHSDPNTTTPYQLNGLDINVGAWVGDYLGQVFKIVQIESVSETTGIFVLEDVGLVNSLNDLSSSFYGLPYLGNCVIFNISENGNPILDGLVDNDVQATSLFNINARFIKINPKFDFVSVYQTNNGFALGDFIRVDEENVGRYELCSSSDINQAVGIINSVGNPKADYFTFKPLTEIQDDVQPPLVGAYGDIFYMDPANPGKVTSAKPATNAKPVYIRLENEHRAVRLNAIVDMDTIVGTFKVASLTQDQTTFTMPEGTTDVIDMSINGIENKNFTYDPDTRTLVFNPVATGYGIDFDDQVIFTYETQK